MQRPGNALIEPALNGESSVVRRVGDLQLHGGRRIREEERFANLEILDRERPSFEQLHPGFKGYFDEGGGRENEMVLDLMILQESHVP
jgi:hypothetical protein